MVNGLVILADSDALVLACRTGSDIKVEFYVASTRGNFDSRLFLILIQKDHLL